MVADFGLTVLFDGLDPHTCTGAAGSTRWMAPELHSPEQYGRTAAQRSQSSDIYSFGCLCLEVRAQTLLRGGVL
jgi:serine/threonine protein kinase